MLMCPIVTECTRNASDVVFGPVGLPPVSAKIMPVLRTNVGRKLSDYLYHATNLVTWPVDRA